MLEEAEEDEAGELELVAGSRSNAIIAFEDCDAEQSMA